MEKYNPQNLTDAEYILSVCPTNIRNEWEQLIYEEIGEDYISMNWYLTERLGEIQVSCRYLCGVPFYTKETLGNPQEGIDEQNMRIICRIKTIQKSWNDFRYKSKKQPTPTDISNELFYWENPYKVDGLFDFLFHKDFADRRDRMTDKEIWETIIDIWVDTEFPYQSQHFWEFIFRVRPAPSCYKKDLPDVMKLYRGGKPNGWSWTLDKEKGLWFADRNAMMNENSGLYSVMVKKTDVLFHTDQRGEDEVVFIPTNQKIIREKREVA